MFTLLALITPALSQRRPLQRRPWLALFFKCSRSNSHRQTYNVGPFNAISRKITPFSAGVIRANQVLNIFSKICERVLHENPTYYVNKFLSKFTDHLVENLTAPIMFLLRLIESWKKSMDQKNFVGAVVWISQKIFILYHMTALLIRCMLIKELRCIFLFIIKKTRKKMLE